MTVAVSNESQAVVEPTELEALAQFVLNEMGVDAEVELSVTLVDELEMSRLHEEYLGEPGPTDVLAFPMDDLDEPNEAGQSQLLGDVILCPSIAVAQARDAGHDMSAELRLLCTHGVLHLLGYDHHDPDDEREMFGLQARLLGTFGGVTAS